MKRAADTWGFKTIFLWIKIETSGLQKNLPFNRSVPWNCLFGFKLFSTVPSTQKCSHRQFPLLSVLPFLVVGTVSVDLWSWHMSNTLEEMNLFSNCYFCLFPRMVRISAFWMSRGLPRTCSPSTSNTTISPASYDSLTCVSISCSYVVLLPSSLLLGLDLYFFKQSNWLGGSFTPENLNSGLEFALQKKRITVELGLVFVFCVSALSPFEQQL